MSLENNRIYVNQEYIRVSKGDYIRIDTIKYLTVTKDFREIKDSSLYYIILNYGEGSFNDMGMHFKSQEEAQGTLDLLIETIGKKRRVCVPDGELEAI